MKKRNKVIAKYPIPEKCIYCGDTVNLVSNSVVYGREYGNGLCYKCVSCDSYVGVHHDRVTPLGRLADNELRKLKQQAHTLFDPLWKTKPRRMSRQTAYDRLADKLGIPAKECHFGWFDREMLLKSIEILSNECP